MHIQQQIVTGKANGGSSADSGVVFGHRVVVYSSGRHVLVHGGCFEFLQKLQVASDLTSAKRAVSAVACELKGTGLDVNSRVASGDVKCVRFGSSNGRIAASSGHSVVVFSPELLSLKNPAKSRSDLLKAVELSEIRWKASCSLKHGFPVNALSWSLDGPCSLPSVSFNWLL